MKPSHLQLVRTLRPFQPGVQLHFVEMGHGPVICLCHGFPESWLSWRYQVMEEMGRRVDHSGWRWDAGAEWKGVRGHRSWGDLGLSHHPALSLEGHGTLPRGVAHPPASPAHGCPPGDISGRAGVGRWRMGASTSGERGPGVSTSFGGCCFPS